MPVTGIFITHAPKVEKYSFRHIGTGRISTIKATPDHPFYVRNSNSFIPVARLSPASNLLNNRNEKVKIICPTDQKKNCGSNIYTSLPVQVYNLEVYKKHSFYAGNEKILVHNCNPSVHSIQPDNSTVATEDMKVLPYHYITGEEVSSEDGVKHRLVEGYVSYGSIQAAVNSIQERISGTEYTVLYRLPKSNYTFNSGTLMIKLNNSATKNPQQLGEIMRTAQNFERAKTIFVINNGLDNDIYKDYPAAYTLFINYFKALANDTDKDVIFNLEGRIRSSQKGEYSDIIEFGFYNIQSRRYYPNKFTNTHYMRVRPDN